MANKLGKRLGCEVCGAQIMVTKAGEGEIKCCDDKALVEVKAKPLASAD